MLHNELRFVSLVGDARRQSSVQAIANTLDELAPDDVEVSFLHESQSLPPFDHDLRDVALPLNVATLSLQICEADAVVIVAPDVTGSVPGVLKNALDWLGSCPSQPLAGRAIAVVMASAGPSGGIGARLQLHRLLSSLGATVLDGADVAVSDVDGKVDAGTACLRDEETRRLIGSQLAALARLVRERRIQTSSPG